MRNIEHARMLERIWILLQDCGLPEQLPHRDLLLELYWMIEEHYEVYGDES